MKVKRRVITAIVRMDVSNSQLPDDFWTNYFRSWANRAAVPTTVETSISVIEEDDGLPIQEIKAKVNPFMTMLNSIIDKVL